MGKIFDSEDSFILKMGLLFLVLLGAGIYYLSISVSNYPHDNPIEEVIEKMIEKNTGVNIDLSPDSPEKNK